jgi:phosphoglycolate phosphatase
VKLLIFDIDGTLTHLNGATRRAFDATYLKLFGVHVSTDSLKLHGRTDPLIFRDLHRLSGVGGDLDEAFARFCEIYVNVLPASIAASPGAHLHVGVPELLAALDTRKAEAALALGTGNMRAGAMAKIRFFGLDDYFPVGGFGDIHHDRADLLRDAVRDAEAYYHRRFNPADTWVIGDTVHDIEGGKAVGLKTMGVATGGAFSYDDLAAAAPDALFHDFADTSAVLAAFGLR